MSKYWSNIVKKISPYVPGEQPKDKKYIKLNTNENPYPPSEKVLKAISAAVNESLRLYPDPACESLRNTLAKYYGIKASEVFVGNGSDELLAFSFMAFFNPGDTIIFPDITYSFYEVYSSMFSVNYRLIPLDDEFNVPVEEFFTENDGIILANPNAPTGKALPLESIRKILEKNDDKVVIIDEAYVDFGARSSVPLIKEFENLLVIQTLSKSRALAGLRVGFALGSEQLIEGLDRVKNSINSYTLDRLALIGAEEAIKDHEYFCEIRDKIINTREWVSKKLSSMGFKVIESKANFIFISHPKINGRLLFEKYKENNILVRHFNSPRIDNFLRVSIGSDEEMNIFCEKTKEIIESLN
ncbi:histidinol-phosphate aminotransferase [Acetivibrio thermocellus AD2]|jgi:histidinol-phosphate aminotransferase|uniref:Histidinol-phosphate aminotransferase n=1 Tax=Acetivibrio thermocellus AD2 TaxID=1138384 RepID=A0AB36THV0_ACETH|nr:histidinol-phosphate transaminase [Acetivibrio thermocellus]ADU74680.1 histidinol-phosphate aminotransferase [Acetivibrio thermocellus DSM 1313]ALX08623.1 Histidinol-phosphate aminotransferase [Acetivibrio thermocellus AD2]ANV76372.1 Histidinol-phosphate aminotransferase [Acetivibrio thermocellus DSM 2360]EIC05563.1 Histidinol-phosphate aminotransferase [Acetivibrio thermocellus YS]PFH02896.1 histidinol-phosphate aminotransferase [Acetivibrio thermocellus AD2]